MQNEVTVVQGWADGKLFHVSGQGYNPEGKFLLDEKSFDPLSYRSISLLLHGSLLCNDANLEKSRDNGNTLFRISGDPAEGSMVVAAAKAALHRDKIEEIMPRIMEIPFDSDRKRMTTIHECRVGHGGGIPCGRDPLIMAFTKGVPDVVINLADTILWGGKPVALTEVKRDEILSVNRQMADRALKVLAIAYRRLDSPPISFTPEAIELNLTFIGLLGMAVPPREEAKEAVTAAPEGRPEDGLLL